MYHKIILLGEPKAGKTTLRRTFMGESFVENYIQTIGFDFSIKKHDHGAFQIWDIAGQATDKTLKNYIDGTSGAIIVFDVMVKESLVHSARWLDLIHQYLEERIPVIIVGNKIDLRTEIDGINNETIKEVYSKLESLAADGEITYHETSALTGENVEDAFKWLFDALTKGGENT